MDKALVVVAQENIKEVMYVLVKKATEYDYIEINFVDKYASTVILAVDMLHKGCGWSRVDEGKKEVLNAKCIYNNRGDCSNKNLNNNIKCREEVRLNCKEYKRLHSQKFKVNFIMIEKAGGIRGMGKF